MCLNGELFDGFILSGTNGPQGLLAFGLNLAAAQMRLQGNTHRSLMLNAIVFGPYNKGFGPIRTPFDWLSGMKRKWISISTTPTAVRYARSFLP